MVGLVPVDVVADPDVVIAVDRATVTRDGTDLLRNITWRVELDERWVVLGPNGAGKTTLLNLASARLHPTSGTVHLLGERLGRVDVGELRTRIGLSTVALHDRIPPDELVHDVVLTASWGVVGRFREAYERLGRQPGPVRCSTSSASRLSPNARTAPCPRASANGCRSPAP